MIAFLVTFVMLGRLYRDMIKQPETRALFALAAAVLAVGVVFYSRVEGWSVVDSAYFCVVTLGTVGYGDVTPTTDLGKLFTTVYIIVGLSIIGGFFATAGRLLDPQQLLSRRKVEVHESLAKVHEALGAPERQDEASPSPRNET
jgi:hypothetical protein